MKFKYIICMLAIVCAAAPVVYARDGESGGSDDQDRVENESESESESESEVENEQESESSQENEQESEIENEIETETENEVNHRGRDGMMNPEFRAQKEELKAERDMKKDAFKAEIKANKEAFKMERDAFKEEWKRTATRTPAELKAKIEEMKASMKDRREEIRARLASSTEEIKVRFDEAKKERVKERIANVSGKFDGAIVRMEAFDTKVAAAITKFKDRGVDTTNAEALLSAARAELADVKTNAAAFEAKANAIVEGDEVSRLALKEEAEVVIQSIKDTHADYVAVVVELRASGGLESEQENEQESESENESETETETETSTQ